jgi:hypothetical protein
VQGRRTPQVRFQQSPQGGITREEVVEIVGNLWLRELPREHLLRDLPRKLPRELPKQHLLRELPREQLP